MVYNFYESFFYSILNILDVCVEFLNVAFIQLDAPSP